MHVTALRLCFTFDFEGEIKRNEQRMSKSFTDKENIVLGKEIQDEKSRYISSASHFGAN